ncbi:alkaline phosphatase family protein [Natronolimnohabitans innermongolicus]|uniref:Sulfatase n=1 Tax=Natronolimnohabitans innermongolicus JCM 12255 TaxID=1227499 RepID=L9WH20_9EURY|nr:hypothetical protein [Natronolimnohabitans innermongolicus]ELY48526.1 hypothetical protein C493_21871 [Natronolimnohabitans innermongolicus JCM 12255]
MVSAILPDHYSRENLRRVLENPRLVYRELFHWTLRVNSRVRRALNALDGTDDGFDAIAADWDNLLILDACRYDLFEARNPLEGDLRAVRSKGSDSWEFMEANFAERALHDTVYVTANPHVYELPDDTFHAVENLLETRWDEDAGTVQPEAVVEEAIAAHERYPDKRLIVHFMQPHFPFLGPTGRTFDHMGIEELDADERSEAPNPWFGLIYDGTVDAETVLTAYRENLDLLFPHVERLLESLGGKSVVTADHGNLIGERGFPIPMRMYGHPRGLDRDEVRTVPWLEVEGADRRRTVAEPPQKSATASDEDVVEDRLSALGYV